MPITSEGVPYTISEHGLPVGLAMPPGWSPRPTPTPEAINGHICRLEAWDPSKHSQQLFESLHTGSVADQERRWTYLPEGPFTNAERLSQSISARAKSMHVMVVIPKFTETAQGTASFARVDQNSGTVEVSWVTLSPSLAGTAAATETFYLMLEHAFGLGYRRVEWKTDSLNAPSRRAALRLGFRFDGLWRKAVVYRGRSRDTAWYGMSDDEWQGGVRDAIAAWLDDANFDVNGQQKTRLADVMSHVRTKLDGLAEAN
ncbi:acyl-CoA N-acyltransferase [Gonapodya prolifera JEL478]|uniref:Acyl-CoA N-acyltransferase n=1 Tax=Gonapodya prolifera (strain JEL478) TaxID=1344416 RepID=A0A139ANP3_GONPJ|nr:acyl-CoA N-acyltransferase [Gonapodya prolifera JEL478]|eukprot:KXS18264.1 acyl-CoA N-acyltransferase [Gonapodya prolifera JEL478]